MSIVRDIGFVIDSLNERSLITCSTGNQVFAGSTANNLVSTGIAASANGRVIDRLAALLTARYTVAMPSTFLYASRGSTEANRELYLGVKLQHGDSSGGGDMADYSTGSQPSDRVFFGQARTTDFKSWDEGDRSTGAFYGASQPCYYDLRGAKRYIRAVHYAGKNRVTTESSGDEGARVGGVIAFLGGDQLPQPTDEGATSTSTTT